MLLLMRGGRLQEILIIGILLGKFGCFEWAVAYGRLWLRRGGRITITEVLRGTRILLKIPTQTRWLLLEGGAPHLNIFFQMSC